VRLTIIIACKNAGASLDRCLDSIFKQQSAEVEAVVADGGSKDGTLDILRRRGAEAGAALKWFSEPDGGIAEAWNKAIARATGDWILFLGADDHLASGDVASRANLVLPNALPTYRVVYGQVRMVAADDREVGVQDRPWSPRDFHGCRYNIPHQAVFHHRSLFAEFGPFDTSLRIAAAYDFLLRVLAQAEPLYVPGFVVTRMQIGGLSTSRLNAPRLVAEEARLFRRHVGGVPWLHAWWLLKAWIKYALCRVGGDRLALSVTNLYRLILRGEGPLRY
jgi:glycosyltransferase involved in cell wall biosynthesis